MRYRTHKYYYLTRFMFAFILISLFFAACALFLGLLALCSRIGSYLSGLTCSVALFFQTLAASLMTYVLYKLQVSGYSSKTLTTLQRSLRAWAQELPVRGAHRLPRSL